MKLFVRDKSFYKTLMAIALPIAMQNLITFMVSMMDTVMLGRLGEIQLSAAAIANQVFFVFMVMTMGVSGGANVLIAQYWGKGDTLTIRKIMTKAYIVTIGIAILFTIGALAFPEKLMSIFTTDPLVIADGVKYLEIVGLSYLFYGISNVTICLLRSTGTVKISLVVYTASLITNTCLNYVLIFGAFGAPRLEIQGAAIATCVARVVELIIVVIFMVKFEKKIRFRIKDILLCDKQLTKDFVKNATPVIFNELLWSLGASMIAVVIGRMSTEFVAANSICTVVNQFVTVFIFGIGNAAAVIIGNTIGQGEYKKAHERSITLMVISVMLGLLSGGVMFFMRDAVISIYNVSDVTKGIASGIIAVGSVVVVFQSLAIVTMMGILRGGGDARFTLIADVVFMWLIAIPLGFYTGLHLGWAPVAVYAVLKCDEALKTIFSIIRVSSAKWVQDVTR